MSVQSNDGLQERAAELIEEYAGTMWARILVRDIESGDLESLKFHVGQATAQSRLEEENELLGRTDVY